MYDWFVQNYPWKGNWSVFHGRFSYIRYWWLKQSIIDTTNKKFKANLFEICEELMNELVTNKYLPCDYIGGLAGIISFLVDIYNKQDEVRYKIKKCNSWECEIYFRSCCKKGKRILYLAILEEIKFWRDLHMELQELCMQ